jgi:hypothetical protein
MVFLLSHTNFIMKYFIIQNQNKVFVILNPISSLVLSIFRHKLIKINYTFKYIKHLVTLKIKIENVCNHKTKFATGITAQMDIQLRIRIIFIYITFLLIN